MGLDFRTRELIAVGASVAANCQECLRYHVGKTRENGVEPQENAEAIEIGRMVGKGAAASMKRFASALAPSPDGSADSVQPGCGCGP